LKPPIYPSVTVVMAAIGVSVLFMANETTLSLGVIMISCASIAVFFYNLVWQYGRIGRVIGRVTGASYLYASAFVLVLSGYLCVTAWFLSKEGWAGLLGALLILTGILVAQASNALLLDWFIYGRRWELVEPSGSSR